MNESIPAATRNDIAALEKACKVEELRAIYEEAQAATYRAKAKLNNALIKNANDAIRAVYDAGGYVQVFDDDGIGIRVSYYEDIWERIEFVIPD